MTRLRKPTPTAQDFRHVKRHLAELRVIIEGYIAGGVTREDYAQAKREVDAVDALPFTNKERGSQSSDRRYSGFW